MARRTSSPSARGRCTTSASTPSPSGSAQLLFLDKSSLSIASNTSLVIDDFIYDPASNRGHMLTRLTAGTLQYIGGQLSHQGAVTINTSAVAVGIRGGTVTITHGANGTQITNQYGTITLTNAAGTTVVTQPGYTVRVADRKSAPGQPMRVTVDEVDRNIKKLSSKVGQDGGVKGLKRIDAAGLNCATHATSACPQTPELSTGANDAAQIIMKIDAAGDAADAADAAIAATLTFNSSRQSVTVSAAAQKFSPPPLRGRPASQRDVLISMGERDPDHAWAELQTGSGVLSDG